MCIGAQRGLASCVIILPCLVVCRCRTWNNFTSCVVSSRCTFDDVYQYRLSLGSWSSYYQQRYNSSIAAYQFMCSRTDGTAFVSVPTFVLYIQCESKKSPWGFVAIFPKRLGIFRPNFARLLCVPIYARLRNFLQLSATLTEVMPY